MNIFDIPGEYLHTETYQDVIMLIEGALAYTMVKVAPKIYRKYVIVSIKGKPLLYVQMQEALYVLLRSALLLYSKLLKGIESYGFQINPYEPFVSNKMIRKTDDDSMVCR